MFRSAFITPRLYWLAAVPVGVFLLAFLFPPLFLVGKIVLGIALAILIFDWILLSSGEITGSRVLPQRFSNGDPNPISIKLESSFNFPLKIELIDEVPEQFEARNFSYKSSLASSQAKAIKYELTPTKRGQYWFHHTNVFARSALGILEKRFVISKPAMVAVYPGFLMLQQYELLAISNKLFMHGPKKLRKVGQSLEFEQIKNYQLGDDVRHINWPATARGGELMVNHFRDERSQQMVSIIDKSRLMKFPFGGLTLLDHAINSALVVSNVALRRQDKAGLAVFAEKLSQFVQPEKGVRHLDVILQNLYHLKTRYAESNFEVLQSGISKRLNQRSLLMLYTNFDERDSLQRQMPYIRWLSKRHVLVVVFFKNDQLIELAESSAESIKGIYEKAIAAEMVQDKLLMQKELIRMGIHIIYTAPEDLTINAINKYLEIKSRNIL